MRKPLFIARQGRRPAGFLGHIVARVMARETAPENALTLDLLDLRAGDRVLEVGCGHGRTLYEAATRADDITATGIDFSDVMIRVARRWNRRLIAAERAQIDRGDSAALPFGDNAFTKAYAVHTVYFWERPTAHLREIVRVLAPGGRFVLGFRPGDDPSFSAQFPAEVYHIRSAAEIEAMVVACGFGAVWTEARRVNGHALAWTIARKSAGEALRSLGHRPEHDGERCIPVCEVDYNSKGFPRGTFTCAICGFVYSRIGPDTQPHDPYRVGEVKARGPIWEEKLRQLWFNPDVTIRHMVAVMRSSWGHLRWQGTQLGLPFPPPGVRGRRRTKTPAPLRQRDACVDPTAYRDAWLEVVRQHPDQTVQDLRKQASQTYNWLRYHDRKWLLENTPQKKRSQPRVSFVDWEQQDGELVAEIERGYEQLMSRQEVLFRVSATAILTAIRRRGYYTTNRHHLPKTVAALAQLAESYEDFAIRRVWHIARWFQADGQIPRRRVLAERASVDAYPHRDNPRVQAAVDEADAWLKGDLGDNFIPGMVQPDEGVD